MQWSRVWLTKGHFAQLITQAYARLSLDKSTNDCKYTLMAAEPHVRIPCHRSKPPPDKDQAGRYSSAVPLCHSAFERQSALTMPSCLSQSLAVRTPPLGPTGTCKSFQNLEESTGWHPTWTNIGAVDKGNQRQQRKPKETKEAHRHTSAVCLSLPLPPRVPQSFAHFGALADGCPMPCIQIGRPTGMSFVNASVLGG